MGNVKGQFLEQNGLVIKDYEKDMPSGEKMPRDVYYVFPRPPTDAAIPAFGSSGTASSDPDAGSLIVLDVGRWGSGKEGAAANSGSWTPQRDFGAVYMNHVVLCTFANCQQPGVSDERSKVVNPQLTALFSALDGAGMGAVVVRRYLVADGTGFDPTTVHVFVGDMHIGVLDNGTLAKKSGRRYGRVTVDPLEYVVANLIPADASQDEAKQVFIAVGLHIAEGLAKARVQSKLDDLQEMFFPALKVLRWALEAKKLYELGKMVKNAQDDVRHDTMSDAEVDKWFTYYHQPPSPAKPADIYEQAGKDFFKFADALSKASYGKTDGGADIKSHFIQMGDMFDLWVGFTCHFKPASWSYGTVTPNLDLAKSGFDPSDKVAGVGHEMLSIWGSSILSTTTGKDVDLAINKVNTIGATFLYGNHDNYFGSNSGSGPGNFHRDPSYSKPGIYGEHGHQWPTKNSNDDSADLQKAAQYLIGTPSPVGEMVTQAAFIRPGQIRAIEMPMASLIASKGDYGQRLAQTGAAADLYVDKTGGFAIYVLAHTHAGNLTKVHIRRKTAAEFNSDRARSYYQSHRAKLTVEGPSSTLQWIANALPGSNYYGDGKSNVDITVKWENAIPDNQCWVTLVDPTKPKEWSVVHWVRTDNHGGEKGEYKFTGVRPGKYWAVLFPFDESRDYQAKAEFNVAGVSTALAVDDGAGGTKYYPRDATNPDPEDPAFSPLLTQGSLIVRWSGVPAVDPASSEYLAGLVGIYMRSKLGAFKPWVAYGFPKYEENSGRYKYLGGSSGRVIVDTKGLPGAPGFVWVYLYDDTNADKWGAPFYTNIAFVKP